MNSEDLKEIQKTLEKYAKDFRKKEKKEKKRRQKAMEKEQENNNDDVKKKDYSYRENDEEPSSNVNPDVLTAKLAFAAANQIAEKLTEIEPAILSTPVMKNILTELNVEKGAESATYCQAIDKEESIRAAKEGAFYTRKAILYGEEGKTTAAKEMFHEALVFFNKAIRLYPFDSKYYANRSLVYIKLSEFDLAIRDAEKALSLNENSLKGHFRKGQALVGLKKYDEAERCFMKILEIDPKSEEAHEEIRVLKVSRLKDMGISDDVVELALDKLNGDFEVKTPVSLLQELYMEKRITPKYDLIQIEGAQHEPTFKYRVSVGDLIATGTGQSKKKAKHAAAMIILEKIKTAVATKAMAEAGERLKGLNLPLECLSSPDDDGIDDNPVGRLQELCIAKRLAAPRYLIVSQFGQLHNPVFNMTCIVDVYKETGSGKSKKLAKRQAAIKMIEAIKDIPLEQPAMQNEGDEVVNKTFDRPSTSKSQKSV
ncbi:hypothetical protein QYM36_011474 [Artemia franciscana]|uniref:DRBM domain-containing protein n=2 Tax=Artemia franciscana TaxID=6661 RepID=A0AA88HKA3_ARTSF|nr:hypothetical protein QYM36_011474 [Artemia franciscana]